MLDYTSKLTAEESTFAAEHHDVLCSYLRIHGLPADDFYDIAVFGYLRAVRKYLARPELRQYKFTTIAYRAMSCDVHHSREYWARAKRNREICSFNEEQDSPDSRDTVSETLERVVAAGSADYAHSAAHRLAQGRRLQREGDCRHLRPQTQGYIRGNGECQMPYSHVPDGRHCCGLI